MGRETGRGGLEKLALEGAGGARAEVYLHGAHVTSWIPADGVERLFLSERAEFRAGAAIRGGVPVIFPQFAGLGPLPKHGFARGAAWEVVEERAGRARLRLRDSPATRAVWPHAFEAALGVEVGGDALRLELTVAAPRTERLAFTAALHGYLRVADVEAAVVEGLEGTRYRENRPGAPVELEGAPLRFRGEVDRTYLGAPRALTLRGPGGAVESRAEGFPDVVIWNPGAASGARLADLEPGGWRRFVCVEAAAVAAPVAVAPGAAWRGEQVLRAA